jgi:integrase
MREVDMLPLLREILTEHKAAGARTGPTTPCSSPPPGRRAPGTTCARTSSTPWWPTRIGWSRSARLQPLPLGITPHKLRHTFASILVAIGKDPDLRDAATRAHRPGLHAARLRPDAPQR